MHSGDFLQRRRAPGPDSPDRFIGHHGGRRICVRRNAAFELSDDDVLREPTIMLLRGFPMHTIANNPARRAAVVLAATMASVNLQD